MAARHMAISIAIVLLMVAGVYGQDLLDNSLVAGVSFNGPIHRGTACRGQRNLCLPEKVIDRKIPAASNGLRSNFDGSKCFHGAFVNNPVLTITLKAKIDISRVVVYAYQPKNNSRILKRFDKFRVYGMRDQQCGARNVYKYDKKKNIGAYPFTKFCSAFTTDRVQIKLYKKRYMAICEVLIYGVRARPPPPRPPPRPPSPPPPPSPPSPPAPGPVANPRSILLEVEDYGDEMKGKDYGLLFQKGDTDY